MAGNLIKAPARSRAAGFTMMELLAVTAVLAILAMIAVPALSNILPYYKVRLEAKNAATIMRQARLKAASTQRPTRVVFSCGENDRSAPGPCHFRMQAATFVGGVFDQWRDLPGTRHYLDSGVGIQVAAADGSLEASDIVWAVFMPYSRVYSSFDSMADCPQFSMVFLWKGYNSPARAAWDLTLNSNSGRATLTRYVST
ncbi:hypothetical protein C4J81_00740 [Deltaproteobacteria bacterium Smac51]|nr:hypothetical protein C4J81_00740 [Deltaproteobacteria bacterium Smac51]